MPTQDLNTPPMMGPPGMPPLPPFPSTPGAPPGPAAAPGAPPPASPGMVRTANGTEIPLPPGTAMSTEQAAAAVASAGNAPTPTMDFNTYVEVDLPGGFLASNGQVIETARVRELNGFDEEKLAKLPLAKNVASYVTELLALGVEDLGGSKPSKDVIRALLAGDRDQLVLGISRATYGDGVKYELVCPDCGQTSEIEIELDKDIPVKKIEDPLVRIFDVELKRGRKAKVAFLNGAHQEAIGTGLSKKTQAEIRTLMLSKSVIEIDGAPVNGDENAIRALSAEDRRTLEEFVNDKQPGPQIQGIPVPCSTPGCGYEFEVLLGLVNLFRL